MIRQSLTIAALLSPCWQRCWPHPVRVRPHCSPAQTTAFGAAIVESSGGKQIAQAGTGAAAAVGGAGE